MTPGRARAWSLDRPGPPLPCPDHRRHTVHLWRVASLPKAHRRESSQAAAVSSTWRQLPVTVGLHLEQALADDGAECFGSSCRRRAMPPAQPATRSVRPNSRRAAKTRWPSIRRIGAGSDIQHGAKWRGARQQGCSCAGQSASERINVSPVTGRLSSTIESSLSPPDADTFMHSGPACKCARVQPYQRRSTASGGRMSLC